MRSLCVYCGSRPGTSPAFAEAARALGRQLALAGRTLVYGGGHVGLMGVVADAALAAGGRVIGVIPQSLVDKEVGHQGLTEQHVVASMHERKLRMSELADGFVALPGGVGTLEELFEIWTWAQLGIHRKPIGLLDVDGFFAPLLTFLDSLVTNGFLRAEHRAIVCVDRDPAALLATMAERRLPEVPKWADRSST